MYSDERLVVATRRPCCSPKIVLFEDTNHYQREAPTSTSAKVTQFSLSVGGRPHTEVCHTLCILYQKAGRCQTNTARCEFFYSLKFLSKVQRKQEADIRLQPGWQALGAALALSLHLTCSHFPQPQPCNLLHPGPRFPGSGTTSFDPFSLILRSTFLKPTLLVSSQR